MFDRARYHEWRLCLINRPLSYIILTGARYCGGVVHVPAIGAIVSDPDMGRAILQGAEGFDSHGPGSFGFLITQLLGPRALINMDGPEHQQMKRRLLKIFSSQYVETVIKLFAQPMLTDLHLRLAAGEEVDVAPFARNFASALACALIGVVVDPAHPEAAYANMFNLATDIMALAGVGKTSLSSRDIARGKILVEQLGDYIRTSYASADVAPYSLTQQLRQEGFALEEVLSMMIVVMIGATELLAYGMPRILAVLIDSGALGQLRADPTLLERAIDESLRLVSPSNVLLRAVSKDTVVLNERFRRGARVLVVLHNILRSSIHFVTPHRFDITRTIDPQLRRLAFGGGPHQCLGTVLAIAQLRAVLTSLLSLPGELRILRRRAHSGKLYPGYAELWLSAATSARIPVVRQ